MRLWIILLFQLFDYSAGRRSLFGWRWRKWQGFMRMRKKYAACEVTDPSLSELQRCGKDGISKHECEHERFCCFKDGACFYPTQVMPPQNLRAHALSEHKIELAWNSYSVPYQFELEVIDITNRGGAKVPLQYVAGTQEYTSIGHLHGCHTFRLTLTALDGEGHRQVTKSTFGKTKCSLSSMRPADKACDFECRDGHFCVTTDNICDGVADCIDGSDELEAMCKVSIIKTTTTESPLSSNAKSTPLNAAQQSESNSDKSYATFLKNFVSEIFTTAHSAPQKMHKIAAHDDEPPKVFNKQDIKSVICDFVAQNCAREDVLFRTLRQDCPESCSGSFFSWKSENANSSPSLLNGVTEEQLSRLRRYLEEIVNEPDDEMPGCLDKDDCALVIFPAELDVQFSAVQFTQEDGLAFREAISSGGVAPIEAHGTNNAHVSLMDNNSSMQELGTDSTIVLKPQVSRDSTRERSDKLVPVKNDENIATVEATENLHVKEVPILTSQKGGVMASDDDNQLAAYQQVSTWQQQQRQLDDNETGHQVSDQQDKQKLENFENTRSVNAVDPNRSLSEEVLSAADSVRIENPEVHNLKRQISTDNLQKGGYDKSASGIGGEKDGTSETDARNSNVFQPEMILKMATENEKLQNEILGSYLMSNSKSPRIATNNQERFSGVIGKARGDEIPAESLSGSTKTGSYEQTIIRSPTAKPISLQDWLILSGLIHELDYSDTSQSGVLDSYALAHTSWSEEEAPSEREKHAATKLNKSPTRGSGTFPERTSQPEVLNNHRDRVAKGDFLTNDDIHLLNEAIRAYVSSTSSSKPKTMEAETYLKPLNELKAFLFTQNGSQNDTSSSSASFQEIHQNNSSEIRSSSDIKDELIINQNAPFTGDQTPQTSKNQNTKFSGAPKTQIVSIGRFSEIEAEKQSALESNWQNKEHSIEKSKSNDLLSATESISENVGIDLMKSISSSHVANEESFPNDGLIGVNQSSQKDVLKSENKLTSSGVLQTKTDAISSDWEHPVSQQALEPIEIPAQQNDFGGEHERSQVSSEDELLDLSRSNSRSESTHGLLELESLNEAQIVDISGSTMLAEPGDETAASKQPVFQEQELLKAVPGHVSHVQQHSLSSISPEIDRTLNKENDVNALAENDTYSHSAANQILPKEESKPKLSISGSNDSPSSAGADEQEERKSAKSDSELVENLTSDGKSGAYASAKYDKIEILNDLRLPELLDALRTGGAYSVMNKETAKGQDSSSATAKSDIPSSSSSKIAPSASVLNPLKEHTSKIQENHADKPTRQLFEARNDPESLQLNNPERQNSELKNEEQSTSNLLSLGAEQAPQHATMMSTSVNIPRVEDEYEHPLSSQTVGGVQNRVEGTQPVELNTLSSNNILEPIEQTMSTTSEAKNSVPKLPYSPSQQSENLKNRHLEESMSNNTPSVGEKSDDLTLFVTENPATEPVTESFRASATRESNLNQAGSAFSGSSKQNVLDVAKFKPDDIIADDIPPNTVASYQVDLGQTDSSNSWQQIPSVDRQSLIGINRLGGDLGSSVSPVYFAESSIENAAAVETAAVAGNSPNAAESHASSIRDDPPQPSVADKLSSNSDSFAAADAESTSPKSQNDKLTSTTGSQTTIQLTDRDTVSAHPQATVIRADEKEAYKGSASTSITDSERSQNRQVNKAAAERTQGENPVKLIQMNENWIDSSNPQITYQAARSDPPMHATPNVQSAVDPNQIDYARDYENHDFNTVSNAKLSNQEFPPISDSQNIYSKTPEAPNQKTTHNEDSQFPAKQAEKALGDERGIEREETVIDEMRASLSASSDTIISENYPQKPKTEASPLVHNVNGGFKDDGNPASGVKTPFQIFPDELVASGALLPSSSAEKLSAKKEAQRENNRPSPSAPDKLAESFSRDVFGAQVAKSSQSSQVTSALFCQSLGICNKENRIEAPAGDNTSQRQRGMRPWSGIDDCTPQCSVVGGKTICSYRKKCMTKSVDLPSLILADVLLNLLRND